MDYISLYMFLAVCLLLMLGYPVAFTLAGTALAFAAGGILAGHFDAGFLAALPARIFGTSFKIVGIFETGVPFAECFDAEYNTCPLAGCCRLQRALKQALEAFYSALDELTLTELVAGNTQLEHLLALADRRKPAGCIGSA